MVQCVAEAGPFDPAAVGSGACGLPWLITSRPGSRPVSWRPGARLPGEHEMATEYRVSTDTIRRAGRAAGPRPGRDAGSQSDLHNGRLTSRKVKPFVRRAYASCCTAG